MRDIFLWRMVVSRRSLPVRLIDFGLRQYSGLEPSVWGGDAECGHEWGESVSGRAFSGGNGATSGLMGTVQAQLKGTDQRHDGGQSVFCQRCGAWRGMLGLEPTVELFIAHLVEAFREVRRVLRSDGVCWIVIADSYASTSKGDNRTPEALANGPHTLTGWRFRVAHATGSRRLELGSLKPKDLCLVPAWLALALQADGWWIRSDIIWAKGVSFCETYSGSVMPESVTDRPTRAHEHVFMLSRGAKYFYDQEAEREGLRPASMDRAEHGWNGTVIDNREIRSSPEATTRMGERWAPPSGRNLRDVWAISPSHATLPHYAMFPVKLVEPMVKLTSRPDSLVLDPFCGTGTVGIVCQMLGRRFVGMDASSEYVALARERLEKAVLGKIPVEEQPVDSLPLFA